MIAYLSGKVLYCDGQEIIIKTNNGIGYQGLFNGIVAEGNDISLYVSHIFRETAQDLYFFKTMQDKKAFELFLTVNGVGPKSAFSLISSFSLDALVNAVLLENKNLLREAPGIGPKTAAQIILDLKDKIKNLKIFNDSISVDTPIGKAINSSEKFILKDALSACFELGFKESDVLPIANKILSENKINKSEQLIQLILKSLG